MNFLDSRLPSLFWDKVVPEPNSGCWLWMRSLRNGYGQLRADKVYWSAHRFTFTAAAGRPIRAGMHVDHLCLNKMCCNPLHLEEVTSAENTRRATRLITHCPAGHEYSDTNTYRRPDRSGTSRMCKECGRANCRRQYARRKSLRAAEVSL